MGELANDFVDSMMDSDETVFSRPRANKPSGPGPCPYCGSKTKIRNGPYGAFFSCVDYPKCKGTRDGDGSEAPKGKGPCPVCNAKTVRRNGPYGIFYGCSRWPDCNGTRSPESSEELQEQIVERVKTVQKTRRKFERSTKKHREAIDKLSNMAAIINKSAADARDVRDFFWLVHSRLENLDINYATYFTRQLASEFYTLYKQEGVCTSKNRLYDVFGRIQRNTQ